MEGGESPCQLPKPLCSDRPDYGTYWNNLSDSERENILHGFDIGLSASWQTSYLEGESAGAIRSSIFDRRQNIGEIYAGSAIAGMVKYFNGLYADPKNTYIDWMYAWLLASISYQDQNSGTAQSDAPYLTKFLQSYGELPGWVHITDVKDVNLLEIEVLIPEPFKVLVRLRGVSTKDGDGTEMTQAQKDRAIKFIKGFAATRGYPFKNCSCTEMVRPQMFYGSRFFDANGVIEAFVRINESGFCLMHDEVKAADLDKDDQDGIVLNEVLLRQGLAYMDDGILAFEEADRLQSAADYAMQQRYNLYGTVRPKPAEKMIRENPKPVNQNCLP
jgi:hypothetical protein